VVFWTFIQILGYNVWFLENFSSFLDTNWSIFGFLSPFGVQKVKTNNKNPQTKFKGRKLVFRTTKKI
jgi:hypothetical protein